MADKVKKVLIVEDDKFLIRALSDKLKRTGFEVEVAHDGAEGLKITESFKPDVVLLDLVMPNMNGFDYLEQINKKNIDTTVLVLSNLGQQEDVDKALELGAKDYFVKADLSLKDVVQKIEKSAN